MSITCAVYVSNYVLVACLFMVKQDVIFRLDSTVYKASDNMMHLDTNAIDSKKIANDVPWA